MTLNVVLTMMFLSFWCDIFDTMSMQWWAVVVSSQRSFQRTLPNNLDLSYDIFFESLSPTDILSILMISMILAVWRCPHFESLDVPTMFVDLFPTLIPLMFRWWSWWFAPDNNFCDALTMVVRRLFYTEPACGGNNHHSIFRTNACIDDYSEPQRSRFNQVFQIVTRL
jgi:hypothetical protein